MMKRKDELLRIAYLGIQNPVVASALHQLSDEYISMVLVMVNGLQPDDDPRRLLFPEKSNELFIVMKNITLFLGVQVRNLKILLSQREEDKAPAEQPHKARSEDVMMQSSLVDDEDQNQIKEKKDEIQTRKDEAELPGFSEYQDLIPSYCKNLELFEEESPIKSNETAQNYSAFINGDNNIVADDQAAIVLRKIYFYTEMLIIWFQMDGHPRSVDKLNLLFKANPSLNQLIIDLSELSSLITKNRGINYSRTVRDDQRKLDVLLNNVAGMREDIESYTYDKNFSK